MPDVIAAHGQRVTVTNTKLVLTPTPLAASLRGSSESLEVPVAEISDVASRPADPWSEGAVRIAASGTSHTVRFAPGDDSGVTELTDLIDAAREGRAPADEAVDGAAGIPGFDFVALDVETANQNWGSICQIGMVKVIDGEVQDRVSWLCKPPASIGEFDPFNVEIHGITEHHVADAAEVGELIGQLSEFVGELPLVAHNAQFDASALRLACLATGSEVPEFLFACSLAQSRSTALDVVNHRLPTLAEYLEVSLDNHHDAAADAAACAGIMVALARRAAHEGSLMQFVHDAGFAMGAITSERVTPVLRDRSGATRALQASRAAAGGAAAVIGAAAAPKGSNQSGPEPGRPARARGARRDDSSSGQSGTAPWQAVATPDTVPEPNTDADPDSPLYGQNVTLTGDFEPHDKAELWNRIAQMGAQVGKNVTKKTTLLVAGEWATMTSKEKRARELRDKGQDIEIWPADKLYEVLGLSA